MAKRNTRTERISDNLSKAIEDYAKRNGISKVEASKIAGFLLANKARKPRKEQERLIIDWF